MTIDALADLLKSRDCGSVAYFHTDHFEPWSTTIDDTSARAVERMANLARSSPYARRLSLFYSVFVPYRLKTGSDVQPGDRQAADDNIVFGALSARQESLAREAIRPLVAADGHELHLHVHHEFWTRNDSHFDHPVSHWVNAHSTAQADRARLDLHFQLCKEAIAREIGAPFDRWAFIHGNWALNASDPLICHVNDEMAMIMKHGGFGDFSFPAGRSYCDPKLETPFTCLPLDLVRAYDDARADPQPISAHTAVMRPDRFFIWNSPIKSSYSSIDYYSAANRKLFKSPEQVVAMWLRKSVCLGRKLFIKTHAHSMNAGYRLTEPDSCIPHTYPDVVALFDCLARVCDRARIELHLQTVNEVMDFLGDLDGGRPAGASTPASAPAVQARSRDIPVVLESAPADVQPLPPVTVTEMASELVDVHRQWLATAGARDPVDSLYESKLAQGTPLEAYEIDMAAKIRERFPPETTRILEIGSGWGGFAILLARLGFETLGFEGNGRRHAACGWHFAEQIRRFPILRGRLTLAPEGLFPEAFSLDAIRGDKSSLCIATNITSSYSAEHQPEILEAAARCDELILDLGRFGQVRDGQAERDELMQSLRRSAFKPIERLLLDVPYEYWRLRSRHTAPDHLAPEK